MATKVKTDYICSACGRVYHGSNIRKCPNNLNAPTCRYCCQQCRHNTHVGTGQICKLVLEPVK